MRVNLKVYEGTGAALSIIEQSQPGDWDVLVIDGIDVPRAIDAGILGPLPKDNLPLDDIDETIRTGRSSCRSPHDPDPRQRPRMVRNEDPQ